MIKHIVMFRFKDEKINGKTKQENLMIAKEGLEELLGVVPGLRSAKVSLNDEKASKSNYDLVLVTTHDDWESLTIYQNHPKHKKVGAFIGTVRSERACVDFEEDEAKAK